MNALNLGSDDEPVVKKKSNTRNLKIALGLAAVILIPTIGSTLAQSIGINAGVALEFGQGQIATTACDTTINVVPASVLTSGTFNLSTITVSTIDAACTGKYFTVKVLAGSSPQVISTAAGTTTQCKVKFVFDGSYTVSPTGSETPALPICGTISSATATSFILTPNATLAAANVDKITLESSTS